MRGPASYLLLAIAVVVVVIVAAAFRGSAAPTIGRPLAERGPEGTPVDVELVLAVDISYSMDTDEQRLQRDGYAAALTSREFMQALREGIHGRIALTYFEWANSYDQRIILPWRLIDGPESAGAVAAEIAKVSLQRASRTSISGALMRGQQLFEESPFRGLRRVIDVSGDGANNNGLIVTEARDEVVGKGIVINGLPIMIKRPNSWTMDITNLDFYYEDCVIGGPGAFVIPIKSLEQFATAIRTKLVLEVAGRTPKPKVLPASAAEPRVSCTIGEQMWRQRWGN